MADISQPQIKTLRSLSSQVHDTDELYRDWLRHTFPSKDWENPDRPSTLDLTSKEADKGIKTLMKATGQRPGPTAPDRPTPPPQAGHPWEGRYQGPGRKGDGRPVLTQEQADEISRIEMMHLGWHENPDRLRGFIKRTLKLDEKKHVGDLGRKEASAVITALRNYAADHDPA